jgi:hypothetical protein
MLSFVKLTRMNNSTVFITFRVVKNIFFVNVLRCFKYSNCCFFFNVFLNSPQVADRVSVLRRVRLHAGQGDAVQQKVRTRFRFRHRTEKSGALQPPGYHPDAWRVRELEGRDRDVGRGRQERNLEIRSGGLHRRQVGARWSAHCHLNLRSEVIKPMNLSLRS